MQEWSIAELSQKMDAGELTSRQLAEMYLSRIALVDEGEDGINSVIELNPDALVIAEQLDAERKEGKVRGRLHGIPVLIKDNIDTFDRMTGRLAGAGRFDRIAGCLPGGTLARGRGIDPWKD